MRTGFLAIIIYAALIETSWAYLNPGTSSLILQGLAASLAVVMGFVTLGWQRIKLFFGKLFRRASGKPVAQPEDEQAS
jgi:hypothetical protein